MDNDQTLVRSPLADWDETRREAFNDHSFAEVALGFDAETAPFEAEVVW
mgnify:FL=1